MQERTLTQEEAGMGGPHGAASDEEEGTQGEPQENAEVRLVGGKGGQACLCVCSLCSQKMHG
jgi:hypothetical protein